MSSQSLDISQTNRPRRKSETVILEALGDHIASSDFSPAASAIISATTETAISPGDVGVIVDKGSLTDKSKEEQIYEAEVSEDEQPPPTSKKVLAVISLAMGMLLGALDGTLVSTALPTIAADLNGKDSYSWVATAYLLSSTALQPLWGKFGDLFGRKYCMIFNLLVFMLASIMCALAPTMIVLIIGRAIQGIGGGGIQSLSFVLVAEVVTMRERGKYQGIMASIAGLAAIIGPVIGGAFTSSPTLTWRFCFWINIPVGAVALVMYFFFLPKPPPGSINWKTQWLRVDYIGALLIVAGAVVFLLGLTWGGNQYPWNSAAVICSLVFGLLGIIGFVVWEAYGAKEPAVPTRLFRIRNFTLACPALFAIGWTMFAATFFFPVFFQVVQGASPTTSGLWLMPLLGALILASLVAGILTTKFGKYVIFPQIGAALMCIGFGLCYLMSTTSPLWYQMVFLVIIGIGMGLSMSSLTLTVQAAVAPIDLGPATTSSTFVRSIGGVIGVSVASVILSNVSQTRAVDIFTPIALQYRLPPATIQSCLQLINNDATSCPGVSQEAFDALLAGNQQMYAAGLEIVFVAAVPMAFLGFLATLFLKNIPLKKSLDTMTRADAKDVTLHADIGV